ncbi:hypothetical protein ACFOOM_23845 [Streptomyces echinoruber]|uniref:Uncharacterized protein n=1 Tax=Streptomyces echinoruber TaxID=68898 RepID=A0A918VBN4_9ACTN|nr:hypothetical protein [Streptomyces echinoruber]GGZ84774.1 hypothetical protein GCM10010389_23880 [Streptomyces echinoruber]
MNRDRTGRPPGEAGQALAAQAEGYLQARAHHAQARREAAALCARLPWLTTAQADEVTRHYIEQRLDLTRETLRTIVHRAEQLQGEYEARYALLRRALLRRHAAGACALLACAVGLGAALGTVTR